MSIQKLNILIIIILMISQKGQWGWMNCNLALKRACKKNQNQVFEILESQFCIHNEGDEQETDLNIQIMMEKKLNYEEQSGFTWHKSWNIPTIQIKISKKDISSIKQQLSNPKIYCEITAAYPIRKMVEFYLQEVALEGQTRKQLGSNSALLKFNNLKFSETSFSHERKKFSLVLILYTKTQQRSRSILKSFISIPIYVDSRKQARKKNPVNNYLTDLIPIEAFLEDLEDRHQDKKQSKYRPKAKRKDNSIGEEDVQFQQKRVKHLIEYSLTGFIRYYSSANIRNKLKHPFYVGYHFSKIITFYYNIQLCQTPEILLKLLQKPLKNQSKKLIIMAIQPSIEDKSKDIEEFKKKIASIIDSWKYFFLEIVIKNSFHYNMIMQQKKNRKSQKSEKIEQQGQIDENDRRWVYLNKQLILKFYSQYWEKQSKNAERKFQENNSDSNQQNEQNLKKYENYEIHQMIEIQSSFMTSKKIKLDQS